MDSRRIKGIVRSLVVAGIVAAPMPANAGSVPAGGANWSIVNDAFAAAVRQQNISARSVLPTNTFKATQPVPITRPVPVSRGTATKSVEMDEAGYKKWGWLEQCVGKAEEKGMLKSCLLRPAGLVGYGPHGHILVPVSMPVQMIRIRCIPA